MLLDMNKRTIMKLTIRPSLFVFAFAFSSCMLGPDFIKPSPDLPVTWVGKMPPKADDQAMMHWWTLFGDAQLNSLIQQALEGSPDMNIALIRIREARASLRVAESDLYPQLGSSLSESIGTSNGLKTTEHGRTALSADLSWEADIFGGNRRSIESVEASLLATEASAKAVRVALLADVASMYFTWITATEQLSTAQEQLRLQKVTTGITEKRHAAGFVPRLDVEQARSQVATTESRIPSMMANQKNALNNLAAYMGTFLQRVTLSEPSSATVNRVPKVPGALPSDLLRRRPDIIAAEANLHAATADLGVSIADLYPRFSLSSSIRAGASDFKDMFSSDGANWSLGGGVTQPIFQGGALRARVKGKQAALDRVAESYRKSVVTAVNEVESALIDYQRLVKQYPFLLEANRANKAAAELSLELYRNGQTDFINVASAQRSWLGSEEALIVNRQDTRQIIAQIYKALGGGW